MGWIVQGKKRAAKRFRAKPGCRWSGRSSARHVTPRAPFRSKRGSTPEAKRSEAKRSKRNHASTLAHPLAHAPPKKTMRPSGMFRTVHPPPPPQAVLVALGKPSIPADHVATDLTVQCTTEESERGVATVSSICACTPSIPSSFFPSPPLGTLLICRKDRAPRPEDFADVQKVRHKRSRVNDSETRDRLETGGGYHRGMDTKRAEERGEKTGKRADNRESIQSAAQQVPPASSRGGELRASDPIQVLRAC
nr:hypothetical protein CFP56_01352 [Quercus suber]